MVVSLPPCSARVPSPEPKPLGLARGRGGEGFPPKAQNSQPFPEADQLHTPAAVEGYVFLSSFLLKTEQNKRREGWARLDRVKLGWAAEGNRVDLAFSRLVRAESDARRNSKLVNRAGC